MAYGYKITIENNEKPMHILYALYLRTFTNWVDEIL